jgi:hypothetical protein
MFTSKSIPVHLARGAIGIGAFLVATSLGPQHPGLSLGAIAVALVVLRGCPTCWTIGLVQTVIARVRGKPTTGFCVDGRCSLAASSDSRHVA